MIAWLGTSSYRRFKIDVTHQGYISEFATIVGSIVVSAVLYSIIMPPDLDFDY